MPKIEKCKCEVSLSSGKEQEALDAFFHAHATFDVLRAIAGQDMLELVDADSIEILCTAAMEKIEGAWDSLSPA